MADRYYECVVKVHEDDLKEYLSEFCDEEQIKNMDLENEISEILNGILQNDFSDFFVIGKNDIYLE